MDEFRRQPVNRLHRPGRPSPIPPSNQPPQPEQPQATQPVESPQPVAPQPIEHPTPPPKKSKKKALLWSILGVFGFMVIAVGSLIGYYFVSLQPVDRSNETMQEVRIVSGSTPDQIATLLEDEGLVKSSTSFLWHARVQGVENALQAGLYRFSPSQSTPEIVEQLSNGVVNTFTITFLPGSTLAENRQALVDAGYSEEEVDAGLTASYDSPLFAGRPNDADLEGYIYGETYTFGTEATVEAVLEHVFDYYYGVIEENNLEALYAAQGLNLYEGITLASIVQREASPGGDDMPQIAQVFYSRLAIDMPLGSDVTYQYIADKTGVPRDPTLESPYNTRVVTGLPPGPIAVPGEKALIAVANPAEGDYLYFLSGDDDITYYARTLEEHEANIRDHCTEKCQIL